MEPIRVMVVDDAADARLLIGILLEEHEDLEVVAEADGATSALAQLADARPDVALLDARMPAVDGFELTRSLLDERPDLHVAILTSMVDDVVRTQARAAGARACLSKGDLPELARHVRELAS